MQSPSHTVEFYGGILVDLLLKNGATVLNRGQLERCAQAVGKPYFLADQQAA
jgi:hypothetical protein